MSTKKEISNKAKKIIDRLSILRKRANLSMLDLSHLIGKADTYISQIERYDFEPTLTTVLEIISIFHIDPAIVFSDKFHKYIDATDSKKLEEAANNALQVFKAENTTNN